MQSEVYEFATSYTPFPGGRYRRDGRHSGEQFLEDVLIPRYQRGVVTILRLNDVIGFPTSFLDGAFSEFASRFGIDAFREHFQIEVGDDESLDREITSSLERGDEEFRKT